MDFIITVTTLSKDQVGIVDNIHEEMGNFSREMETIRKSQRKGKK